MASPARRIESKAMKLSAQERARLAERLMKTYQGFPHGMPTTQADTINTDLLAFVQS